MTSEYIYHWCLDLWIFVKHKVYKFYLFFLFYLFFFFLQMFNRHHNDIIIVYLFHDSPTLNE